MKLITQKEHDLIKKAFDKDKYSIAQLISKLESSYLQDINLFYELFSTIQSFFSGTNRKKGKILSFTGTPGVGKSSLLQQLIQSLFHNFLYSMAILAIDPSSSISKGSLLGDRVRFRLPIREKKIYFRSQPSNLNLGGLSNVTFPITLLLSYIFDFVILETVGIGQNEIESHILADHTFLVLQPLSGDEIQFLKAGIMETPDVFIINKCDEVNISKQVKQTLKNSLQALNIHKKILTCSALYNHGFKEMGEFIIQELFIDKEDNQYQEKEFQRNSYFLKKIVKEEYGNLGLKYLTSYQKGNDHLFRTENFLISYIQIYKILGGINKLVGL